MKNTTYDCSTFKNELPDLVLTPGALPTPAAAAHLRACPPCAEEYLSFQSTFAVLDTWTAPEPSPYFDQKFAVRLREQQAAPPMNWFERFSTSLQFNTGRNFRPMLAGALALAVAVGGGSLYTANYPFTSRPPAASATVTDLQILDRNEQAFQTMDVLQQEEDSSAPAPTDPTPTAGPTT